MRAGCLCALLAALMVGLVHCAPEAARENFNEYVDSTQQDNHCMMMKMTMMKMTMMKMTMMKMTMMKMTMMKTMMMMVVMMMMMKRWKIRRKKV